MSPLFRGSSQRTLWEKLKVPDTFIDELSVNAPFCAHTREDLETCGCIAEDAQDCTCGETEPHDHDDRAEYQACVEYDEWKEGNFK